MAQPYIASNGYWDIGPYADLAICNRGCKTITSSGMKFKGVFQVDSLITVLNSEKILLLFKHMDHIEIPVVPIIDQIFYLYNPFKRGIILG